MIGIEVVLLDDVEVVLEVVFAASFVLVSGAEFKFNSSILSHKLPLFSTIFLLGIGLISSFLSPKLVFISSVTFFSILVIGTKRETDEGEGTWTKVL